MEIRFRKEGGFAGITLKGELKESEIPQALKESILENIDTLRMDEEPENPQLTDAEEYTIEIDDSVHGKCSFSTSNPSSVRNKIARQIVRHFVRLEIEERGWKAEEK